MYCCQQDVGGAEPLLKHAANALEKQLGPEHPDTLVAVSKLALLHYLKRNFEDAANVYAEVLEKQERVLGEEHPDTIATVAGLVESRWKSVDASEASAITKSNEHRSDRAQLRSARESLWPRVKGEDQLNMEVYLKLSVLCKLEGR